MDNIPDLMPKITVDGKSIEAKDKQMILQAGGPVLGAADHYGAFLPGTFRDGLSSRVWVWLIVGFQAAATIATAASLIRSRRPGG